MAELTTVRNVGPAMAIRLQAAGIRTAEALREIGADGAYARMIAQGDRPHFIGYYSLVMGLQGRPWNDARGAEKDQLRARFDALVANARTAAAQDRALPQSLADALNRLGVVDRRKG